MKKCILTITVLCLTVLSIAQVERPKWELGGGLRLSYQGLSGGFSGERFSDGYNFKLNYKDIGMDNYAPSLAMTIGGRYKKWNLFFAGSKGSYDGNFVTDVDITHDGVEIPEGSEVDGNITMGIYALSTTFALIQKKHDLGVGLGFLILNMGSSYKTQDVNQEEIDLGGNNFFPMPFLALSGRLNFGKFRAAGSGGGAHFSGVMDGFDYEVFYYTFDVKGVYDFYQKDNWSSSVSLGYRKLFMVMDVSDERGWAKEEDNYSGPYASIRVKFSSTELWTHISRKERKKREAQGSAD